MKPYEIWRVFDNFGETTDRYSIYVVLENGDDFLVNTCKNPMSPMGIWQIDEVIRFDLDEFDSSQVGKFEEGLGWEINWSDLPNEVKQTVLEHFDIKES